MKQADFARVTIEEVVPSTTTGEFPAKAVAGQQVRIGADIFKDGHDVLAARVAWRVVPGFAERVANGQYGPAVFQNGGRFDPLFSRAGGECRVSHGLTTAPLEIGDNDDDGGCGCGRSDDDESDDAEHGGGADPGSNSCSHDGEIESRSHGTFLGDDQEFSGGAALVERGVAFNAANGGNCRQSSHGGVGGEPKGGCRRHESCVGQDGSDCSCRHDNGCACLNGHVACTCVRCRESEAVHHRAGERTQHCNHVCLSGESEGWSYAPLFQGINDRWSGVFTPTENELHEFRIEVWVDQYRTWRHKAEVKLADYQDISTELLEAGSLFRSRAAEATSPEVRGALEHVLRQVTDGNLNQADRCSFALEDHVAQLFAEPIAHDHVTKSERKLLWVDRERAGFGSWYEAFPRSLGGLRGLADHLDYVADMNFDVLYIPPIHPIGRSFRKGKNNTLTAEPGDVGSPWAIGAAEGGHTEIHPDLGSFEDFAYLVDKANERGIDIALDYALQCSPDHPWVTEHPEWFHHRPDGTIAYAENPPKKYQDIYPLNFWPEHEADRIELWEACREVVEFWVERGVKILRVDNPHTKPMAFWAWMIPQIQAKYPHVFFLSEAFTRPKVMRKLAEVGFGQSYTYFTWRTNKWELTEYACEVGLGESAAFMRPNFWPNTQDILADPLRDAPLAAFRQRFVLASTMVPSYGIYSGFEFGENEPASPENTEYLHSEKYEIRERDFTQAHLAPYIARVNAIRREHKSFQELGAIRFHSADNDQVLAYSRRDESGSDVVLVVVSIDPYHPQEATVSVNCDDLGVPWHSVYSVVDLLSGEQYSWSTNNYVRLTPQSPAHILHIQRG